MIESIEKRALKWALSDDTGGSSIALCGVMSAVEAKYYDYPSDPSDLGRCLRLLELIPEWKPRIVGAMSLINPGWSGLVAEWDEISKMMSDEVGIDWSKGKSAPKTYDAMKKAIAKGYIKHGGYVVKLRDNGHLSSVIRKECEQ